MAVKVSTDIVFRHYALVNILQVDSNQSENKFL